MPYIGNNPKVTELNVSTKSVDILADVDTVSDAPEIGQVLKWNGTNWVPEDDTGTGGGGGGATTSDLQGVTDNGSSTTNTIDAAGFKLNADQLSSVAGTQGDIKKIGGLPYYHDGTAWKRFYLFDNVEDATTVDVNWDDVQVRFDFELGGANNTFINHVNQQIPYWVSGNYIARVNSPVKFGTSSLRAQANSVSDAIQWYSNTISTDVRGSTLQNWSGAKRGGCIDWSADWTLETWIYFGQDSLDAGPIQYGLIGMYDGTSNYQGITIGRDQSAYKYVNWYNNAVINSIFVETSPDNAITEETWHHLTVMRTAADSKIHCYWNGIYRGHYVDINVLPMNVTASARTYLGAAHNNTTSNTFSLGSAYNLDDFRITQYARYTPAQNFAPPTAAYPITAPAPATIDDNWSNVQFRATYDTNLNDTSQNTLTGTGNGSAVSTNSVKYGASSVYVNSYTGIEYGNATDFAFLTDEWTFEAWIRFESLPIWDGGARPSSIFNFGSNFGAISDNLEFGLASVSSSNNEHKFMCKFGNASYTLTSDSDKAWLSTYLTGRWVHVALTKENTNSRILLFVDGYAMKYSNADTALIGQTVSNYSLNPSGKLSIGGRSGNASWTVTGYQSESAHTQKYLDDVRISDYVRYTENFTPPTGPLGTTGSLTTAPTPASSGEGAVALGTTPGWNGTTGWTVQRSQAGIYRVYYPGTFPSTQSYVVHATINDGPTTRGHVRIIRYQNPANYFDMIVTNLSDGTALDTGYVAVRLVDLSTV